MLRYKTESILFATRHKIKRGGKLNITFEDIKLNSIEKLFTLGMFWIRTCLLNLWDKKYIRKLMRSLIFLRTLCNALIQSHLIYRCLAYCEYITKNKDVCYSLQLSQGLKPASVFQIKTWLT